MEQNKRILEVNRYSTIRKQPAYLPPDGLSLTAFYDALLRPATLLLTIAGYVTLVLKDSVPQYIEEANDGNPRSALLLLLVFVSLVGGVRIVHSIYLAKRDYSHLENGFFDIVVFGAVLLFTTGSVVLFLQDAPEWLLIVYASCAGIGTLNFLFLYARRLPADADHIDYPMERRIQLFNIIVFLIITVAFSLAAYAARDAEQSSPIVFAAVSSTIPLFLINMIYSHQLTMMPKFLLSNDPDNPTELLHMLRRLFPRVTSRLDDSQLQSFVGDEESFDPIRLVRAKRADVEKIAASLLDEFGYAFQFLLRSADSAQLHAALRALLLSADGLGRLGYMSFYVLERDGEQVGFVKLESGYRSWFHTAYEASILPVRLGRILGFAKLPGMYGRAKEIEATQPSPRHHDVRIAYLVVFPQHRRRGFAAATLELLARGLVHSRTTDIAAERISAYVRESNNAALRLFRQCGFAKGRNSGNSSTSFSSIASMGTLAYFEYS